MSIEILKSNLMQGKSIIEQLAILNHEIASTKISGEKAFLGSAIDALFKQLIMINNAIPNLVRGIGAEKQTLPEETTIVQVSAGAISLNKDDRKKFLEEFKISGDALKKLRREKRAKKMHEEEFKKPSAYVTVASKIFSKQAFRLADAGFFKQLNENLRKANMSYLLSTYISTMLFSAFLVFAISFFLALLFSFFDVSMVAGKAYPVFKLLGFAGIGLRLLKNIFFSFVFAITTFWLFYIYPSTQAASISSRVRSELPFAVIHMSSIAGSGIEPSRIFKILAMSTEYPAISKEIRKIINYVNLYGYDLITSLRAVAKTTSSEKLSELLNGIATNISGGGSLSDYLGKKAEDTLLDYKLERKKYSNIAETSMDIYIGILIAAPLIFMVLLIVMNVTGMGFGMSMQTLSYLIVAGISLINIAFLLFLQFRQPA
jgi:Flp pilus assembly protein TadB